MEIPRKPKSFDHGNSMDCSWDYYGGRGVSRCVSPKTWSVVAVRELIETRTVQSGQNERLDALSVQMINTIARRKMSPCHARSPISEHFHVTENGGSSRVRNRSALCRRWLRRRGRCGPTLIKMDHLKWMPTFPRRRRSPLSAHRHVVRQSPRRRHHRARTV